MPPMEPKAKPKTEGKKLKTAPTLLGLNCKWCDEGDTPFLVNDNMNYGYHYFSNKTPNHTNGLFLCAKSLTTEHIRGGYSGEVYLDEEPPEETNENLNTTVAEITDYLQKIYTKAKDEPFKDEPFILLFKDGSGHLIVGHQGGGYLEMLRFSKGTFGIGATNLLSVLERNST